ncbi:MAG TPA: hypothetical protein ENK14_11925 [Caldithrix sp.]|nr:hypothetical protein [Caldithrix sp.]
MVFFWFFCCKLPPCFSNRWYTYQTEHFEIIYKPAHAHLVKHIAVASEEAFGVLADLFDYHPTEKIIINTYDFSDYGAAGTTTLPQNYIRLQIGPLELGYEVMPFTDRFQWLINHELVHVIVNDKANSVEAFSRKLFSKVPPENVQPLTIAYSLVTNHDRFTPRWHQEGIAVFLETWLSGGYGRVLGNFDEMYFRALTAENRSISDLQYLDAKESYTSFLVETLFYLYGSRFCTYLAVRYSPEKLLAWYTPDDRDWFRTYAQKFKKIFGIGLDEAWRAFGESEKAFQQSNLARLRSAPFTPVRPLTRTALGWVTSAYPDSTGQFLFFGNHQPHHLTAINRFSLRSD